MEGEEEPPKRTGRKQPEQVAGERERGRGKRTKGKIKVLLPVSPSKAGCKRISEGAEGTGHASLQPGQRR